MSSLIWYIYDFARKAWVDGFANARSKHEIMEKPERFRDFPKINPEFCIACGACTASCPSPNAIKLVRDEDNEQEEGMTYTVIFDANGGRPETQSFEVEYGKTISRYSK